MREWDLQGIIEEVWGRVSKRDWHKDKLNGGEAQDTGLTRDDLLRMAGGSDPMPPDELPDPDPAGLMSLTEHDLAVKQRKSMIKFYEDHPHLPSA